MREGCKIRIERVLHIEIPDKVEETAAKIWATHKEELERLLLDKDLNVEKKLQGLLQKILPSDEFRALTEIQTEDSLFILIVCLVTVAYAIGEIGEKPPED